jgi:hypothetical protein
VLRLAHCYAGGMAIHPTVIDVVAAGAVR